MNLQEFAAAVAKQVENLMSGMEAEARQNMKNNGVELMGITVGAPESRIRPTVYIDRFFKEGASDREIAKAADFVKECVSRQAADMDKLTETFDRITDFDAMKSRICFRLVSRDKNAELLAHIPSREWNDLVIIYAVILEETDGKISSGVVNNMMMDAWGITEEEAYRLSMENTPKLMPAQTGKLDSVVGKMLGDVDVPFPSPEELIAMTSLIPIQVCSNESTCYGAGVILYDRVLKDLSDKLGGSLYILPSSVHEMLVLPADGFEPDALLDMVKNVNGTNVTESDFLADSVYFYDAADGSIKKAA